MVLTEVGLEFLLRLLFLSLKLLLEIFINLVKNSRNAIRIYIIVVVFIIIIIIIIIIVRVRVIFTIKVIIITTNRIIRKSVIEGCYALCLFRY